MSVEFYNEKISAMNPEILAKAGLGQSKGFKQLEFIINILPATLEEIMKKTGLKQGSVRRYFSIAKNLGIYIMNNKTKGEYEIYVKLSELKKERSK